MRNFFVRKEKIPTNDPSSIISQRVGASLVAYVYEQSLLAFLSSLFCAAMIFFGLFNLYADNTALYSWFGFYLLISLMRIILVTLYRKDKNPLMRTKYWCDLYIIGAIFGGISWGLAAYILLPYATYPQQTLLILMLAGVTAGSLPLSAPIPGAAIGFLIFSILPFIISIAFFRNYVYLLFDAALTLYLIYSIIVVLRAYYLVRNSIELQYENALLLKNLSEAKLQLEMSNEKLEQAATHDPLTQVANRSLFQSNLEYAIKRAEANKTLLALLFIDLDLFKPVNDVYGHDVGDKVLVELIERLKGFFNSDSVIARLGGDEITIILENVVSIAEIKDVAKRLCYLLAMPIELQGVNLKISASIGISCYPANGKDARALLTNADKAMYYAKEHGGNNYAFSGDLKEMM